MKSFWYFYKQLTNYTGYKLHLNLLGMMVVSIFEGIGLFMLIPLLNAAGIMSIHNLSIPLLKYIPTLSFIPSSYRIIIMLSIFMLITITQAYFQKRVTIRNAQIFIGFVNHLRLKTYKLLLEADWLFFLNKRKSDLINLLTSELSRISNGTYMTTQLVSGLIFTSIQVAISFVLSPTITLFVLLCGGLMVFVSRYFIRKSAELGAKTTHIAEQYIGAISDHFHGIKDIKTNKLERSRIEWLARWNYQIEEERLEYIQLKSSSQFLYKVTSVVLVSGLFIISLNIFHAKSGLLLIIILIFSRLWPRFSMVQSSIEQIAASIPAFQSLIRVHEECASHKEDMEDANNQSLYLESGIECRDITFNYNVDRKSIALKQINCFIPANKMTAVVGRSGAGKSTFIDILLGLLKPNEGSLLIDGMPLTPKNHSALRKTMSYISQDPFLFNETIRENLLLVKPDASEKDIWDALDFSQATDFVLKQSNGLDTFIGDRGVKLSGGERQRLVLARAMLRRPSILILDEATSALDAENEIKIQQAIEQIAGKITVIVIAHRLSTIRKADQVLVFEQGHLIEQGSYHSLASEKESMFQHFLYLQQNNTSAGTKMLENINF